MIYEEHVECLKGIKPFLQGLMRKTDYEGQGEKDAKEIGETIDAAIDSMKKRIPLKVVRCVLNADVWYECPACRIVVAEYWHDDSDPAFCPECGQALDWSEYEQ